MTALLDRLGPDSRTGVHLLALPARTDVLTLARSWFPDAEWFDEPVSLDAAAAQIVPQRGARFRGMAAQPVATPGRLALTGRYVLTGPHPLTAEDTVTYAFPPRQVDAYAVRLDDGEQVAAREGSGRERGGGREDDAAHGHDGARTYDGAPEDDGAHEHGGVPRYGGVHGYGPAGDASARFDDRDDDGADESYGEDAVRAWLEAAARHARGAVLLSGTTAAVVPDPGRSVDRTLYSAHALPAQHALALVRTVLVQAVITAQPVPTPGTLAGWTITTVTPYDGTVEVELSRVDSLPPALLQLPWRDSGPFAYAVRWRSGSPDDDVAERPSSLHVVARSRIAPVVERVAAAFGQAVEGTLLDDAGFVLQGGS